MRTKDRKNRRCAVGSITAILLGFTILLSGCINSEKSGLRRYEASFLNLFDTVTTVVGYARTEEEFLQTAQQLYDGLLEYHRLYDIYGEHEGISSIKTINDNAGLRPVKVDRRIIDLLLYCRELYRMTGGLVDVTMGSVLEVWHKARDIGIHDPKAAELPDEQELKNAAEHTGFRCLEIDEADSTVFLTDSAARLDVGAVAKGYAVEQVCGTLPEGLLVSVGGNVCATGKRPSDGSEWVVGIQQPDGTAEEYVHTVNLQEGAVVTSGDYQRYYTVDGKRYHHIIHPDTLYPADIWSAVTVICESSALADGLSTAMFLMTRQEGEKLLKECGAEAMWIAADGTVQYSDGFQKKIRS